MDIKVAELDDKPTRLEFRLSPDELIRLEEKQRFEYMECRADITKRGETIFLHGTYKIDIQTSCDLCLQPVKLRLEKEFDLTLMSAEDRVEPNGDVEISLREPDIDFYEGQKIFLSQYFEDQLILDMPLTTKCREECRGICPTCGALRNVEDCNCSQESGSSPFKVLSQLKP